VTISAPIALQGTQTWTNNSSSLLTIGGSVFSGSNLLTIAGPGNTAVTANISGSGSLTMNGAGLLTLTGSSACNGFSVSNGTALITGSLSAGNAGNLYVGNTSAGAMTVQGSASVTAGELDVNYLNTLASPSTLTITGGSLHVTGQTYVGRAPMLTSPSIVGAALYQTGGLVTANGAVNVGYNGTATSLYSISGGTLNIGGGLAVGGNLNNGGSQGNGIMSISGSAVVNVSGGSGLLIGQNDTGATSGSVVISGGSLTVADGITIGNLNGPSLGSLSRSGGSMTVIGNLTVDGNATVLLNNSNGSVTTSFSGSLVHGGEGTLVIVPQNGDTNGQETLSFITNPAPSGGIIGPWTVRQVSGSNSAGDFLSAVSTSGSTYSLVTANYLSSNFSNSSGTSVVSVSGTCALGSASAYAVKFSGSSTTTITGQLSIDSGGLIINGGTIAGGNVAFPNVTPLIYAGSSIPGVIGSALVSEAGLVKFGPGGLVFAGSNSSLQGQVIISAGTVNVQNALALGLGGSLSSCIMAAGAALAIQGNTALANVPITLNGAGSNGSGVLLNVQDNNSIAGTIFLGSNSLINASAGTLTLAGGLQGNYILTKTSSGTLALAGSSGSQFPLLVTVAGGVLQVQNGAALGPGGTTLGVSVNSGATLQLQGGIAVPNLPLALNGTGTGNNGALESVFGGNSFAGTITLASSNTQINVDSGSLTLGGGISGSGGINQGGTGVLVLSNTTSSYTGTLTVAGGTLSVPAVNNTSSSGPLGSGSGAVVLGNGGVATLEYTGASASSNRSFTLPLGGSGVLQIDSPASNLGISGSIGGGGSLQKTGPRLLTLYGTNGYTGGTQVSGGTLAIENTASINGTSGISIGQGATLQISNSGSSQIPASALVTLTGGNLVFVGNGAVSSGTVNGGASAGALVVSSGQNNVSASRTGGTAYTPLLAFAGSPPVPAPGTTLTYSAILPQIQFESPPTLVNGILGGGIFYGGTVYGTDFATCTIGAPYTVQALADYTPGDLGQFVSNATMNLEPSGSQSTVTSGKSLNSLNLTGSEGVTMSNSGSLTLTTGGLIGNTTGSINGGTLAAANGLLTINAVEHLSISSLLNAGVALVKTGPATLTLTSTSSIAGSTFLNQGTLEYAPVGNVTYGGAISGVGNLLMSGTGRMLTLSGISPFTGATTVSGGTLCVNGSLSGGGPVSLQSGTVLTGGGTILGNVTATAATIEQSAGGYIAGSVILNSGTLTVGQAGSGGYLNVGGGINISGSSSVVAGSTAAALSGKFDYTSSSSATFSGDIFGGGSSVTVDTPAGAALTLAGSNQYGGGTYINGGTLKITNSAALASGVLTMTGGTLDLYTSPTLGIASLGGPGGVITRSVSGTCALIVGPVFASNSDFAGSITNGNGTVGLVLSDWLGGGLILSGNNTYTGGTTVYGGTLYLESANALLPGSGLVVGASPGQLFGPGETMSPVIASVDQVTAGQVTAVPEPATILLLLAGIWIAAVRSSALRRLIYRLFSNRVRRVGPGSISDCRPTIGGTGLLAALWSAAMNMNRRTPNRKTN
jgi:autotransporter-associated beta strand protein